MYGRPVAVVPTWKMLTMCGCPDSLPIAICSRTNRSRLSGSRSAVSTFTATVRSRMRWRQRYTTPNPPRPISSGCSKPAATSSAGIPACTSPCVGRGSLSAIARLALQRRHGGTMATRPELNPNSGAALAMNDDVGRCASRIRYSASRPPRNCGYAHIVGMQQGHAGPRRRRRRRYGSRPGALPGAARDPARRAGLRSESGLGATARKSSVSPIAPTARRYSAMKTGVAYLAVAGTAIIWSAVAGQLVTRVGVKPVLVGGMTMLTAGLLFFTQVSVGDSYVRDLLPGFLIIGLGIGFSFVPISISALAGVKASEAGLASGLINTSQQIGGALGIAALSTIATSR